MRMDLMMQIGGTIGLVLVWFRLVAVRRHIVITTLRAAWIWMLCASLLWSITWIIAIVFPMISNGLAEQMWYASTVLMLCPFIAVLGARRPVSRVWAVFVILPLLIVLEWPALVAQGNISDLNPIVFEAPAIVAFVVVAVMGLGNYIATRYAISAVLMATALLLVVAPLSPSVPSLFPDRFHSRMWATIALSAAAVAAHGLSRRKVPTDSSIDRVWIDFRNWYGIVWAKRIQDRINQTAEKENWPCRLQTYGFVPIANSELPQHESQSQVQIEHTIRWLLRRFVDSDWIDARLNSDNSE